MCAAAHIRGAVNARLHRCAHGRGPAAGTWTQANENEDDGDGDDWHGDEWHGDGADEPTTLAMLRG